MLCSLNTLTVPLGRVSGRRSGRSRAGRALHCGIRKLTSREGHDHVCMPGSSPLEVRIPQIWGMGRVTRLGDPVTVGLTRLGQTLVLEERPTATVSPTTPSPHIRYTRITVLSVVLTCRHCESMSTRSRRRRTDEQKSEQNDKMDKYVSSC